MNEQNKCFSLTNLKYIQKTEKKIVNSERKRVTDISRKLKGGTHS